MNNIKLYRTKPYAVLCYEALFRWLKPNLRSNSILQNDYSNYMAGFRGEKNVDYIVSVYPHQDASIFQGIRLKVGAFYFQIDTLIVTSTFILIVEVKNFKSEIEYDSDSHQLIQYDGNKKKAYKSPIFQAETQKMQLKSWLQRHRFPLIPIETISVLSNPSTILSYKGSTDVTNNFIHLETFPTIMDKVYLKYTKQMLNQKELTKLDKQLLNGHSPHKPDLLKQYDIEEKHLIDGIACQQCDYYPLVYKSETWHCPKCKRTDKTAHEQKILDYFLLINPTITNKECRKILQIKSEKIAYRMLQTMQLTQSGKTNTRKYHSPDLANFPQNSKIPINKKSIFS